MHNDLKKISVSAEEISAMNKRIGEAISRDFKDKNPLFIGLLKGCIPFMPDMLKYVLIPCTIDYVRASSYEGTKTTGDVRIHGHIPNVEGRHVIIVDDIIDTGGTLCKAAAALKDRGATKVIAYGTHPVLSGNAYENIKNSVIDEIVVTNSIPATEKLKSTGKFRYVSLAPMLAEAIRRINNDESISVMFG